MKNIKLFALLTMVLTLASCNNNNKPSESTELTEYDKTVYVCFYTDYNNVDIAKPYKDFMWYPGVPIPLEEVPDMSNVTPPDGFTKFAGWSSHTLIDVLSDLWDFETDTASKSDNYLNLFGVWFAEGEI